jgi:hypothetical protein
VGITLRTAARLSRVTAILVVGAVAAGCALLAPVLGGNGLPGTAPACSWPLRIAGHATPAQAGLVRCYLRAVAKHNLAALRGLVNPTYRVTEAQLAQTPDARAGRASAKITPSPEDTGIASVRVGYADGAVCQFGIEIVNPQSAGSWRIDIGRSVPGPPRPAPAKTPAG